MTPRFHVDWPKEANAGLAEATLAYMPVREGIRVTQAERIITYMFGEDPLVNGQPLPEEVNMAVRVDRIGFFPV